MELKRLTTRLVKHALLHLTATYLKATCHVAICVELGYGNTQTIRA